MRTDKKQKLAKLRHWRIRKKVTGTEGAAAHERAFHQRKHLRAVH
jgi:hypothetical protein